MLVVLGLKVLIKLSAFFIAYVLTRYNLYCIFPSAKFPV